MDVLAVWVPGPLELTVILFVAMLIFGRRLPGMVGDMGKGIREFRKGIKEPISDDETT